MSANSKSSPSFLWLHASTYLRFAKSGGQSQTNSRLGGNGIHEIRNAGPEGLIGLVEFGGRSLDQ